MNSIDMNPIRVDGWAIKEQFKSLRANLEFCGGDGKIFVVTSTVPGEGKTMVTANLAYELALLHKKVLLIDGDLRKSSLSDYLDLRQESFTGLSDVVRGLSTFEKSICQTDQENLFVLLTGSYVSNPTELLGMRQMKVLLAELYNQFDYILIDLPPIGYVSDAAVVAPLADGVIYVVGSDMVSARQVKKAMEQISRTGCKIVGSVLNKVESSHRSSYGNYGGYYGKKYGKRQNK